MAYNVAFLRQMSELLKHVTQPIDTSKAILVLMLFVLNVGDYATTHFALAAGGEEVNPVMLAVIEAFGTHGILAFKTFFILMIVMLLPYIRPIILYLSNAIYAAVVLHNLYLIVYVLPQYP